MNDANWLKVDYEITGIPNTLEGAKDLWKQDPYLFQKWAVETVDGFVTTRRSADGGVDGRLYFSIPNENKLKSMVIEVKGGTNVRISDLRALLGVLENDEALLAGLIIMNPLSERQSANFHQFMAQAGDLIVNGQPYSRLQMLSVPEILNKDKFDVPFPRGKSSSLQLEFNP